MAYQHVLAAALAFCAAQSLVAQAIPATHLDDLPGAKRLIVLSDIGNEPDDQMSLVRLLLYSNEIDLEALIACTSTWQKTTTHAETMHTLIAGYGAVRPNLLLNAANWPTAESLQAKVFTGQPAYGLAATGPDKESPGADAIIAAADQPDARPLWIALWGGANTLAQALLHVRASRSPERLAQFIAKLRISSISDQDDAGPWIRREFPALFYIVQPTSPTSGEYLYATWTGISGDAYYRNGDGADTSLVTNEWLDRNIRTQGSFGKLYPRYLFIMEGDTPSWLNLIPNGLASSERPDFGGWGGRYVYRQPYGETHPIWTQGGDEFGRTTSQDTVIGIDGKLHISDQATIWRWRSAYQNDFAARMAWTVGDYAHANHPPIAIVGNDATIAPIHVDATVGLPLKLDASGSHDPDPHQTLAYHWFHYQEAGLADGALADLTLANADGPTLAITPNATCRPAWIPAYLPCPDTGTAHLILAVTDSGTPPLTTYRRIVLTVHKLTTDN
jgi:hypothetical protein